MGRVVDIDRFEPGPARYLRLWLARARGPAFDLLIAGILVGGRTSESPQVPRDARLGGDTLTILFEPATVLAVAGPSGLRVGGGRELSIPDAVEARLGWHDFAEPPSPATWRELTYRFWPALVTCEASGPVARSAVAGNFPRRGEHAAWLRPL